MNSSHWIAITNLENIPLREGRCVTLGDREIALFRLEDRVLAVDNRCPHKGGPLCDGIVSGKTVVCPLHGRRFDLESGLAVRASEPLQVFTYPVRVADGIVHLDAQSIGKAQKSAA